MQNFEPTHSDRANDSKQVQVLDHVVVMSSPDNGQDGILYADSEWKQYVMTLEDFDRAFKPYHDPFQLEWD